jgi:hypothetical protein
MPLFRFDSHPGGEVLADLEGEVIPDLCSGTRGG